MELFQAAQELLAASSSSLNPKVWTELRDYVEEQLLVTEVMMVQRGGGRAEFGPSSPRYAALMAKTKSYYTNSRCCKSVGKGSSYSCKYISW